MPTRRDFLSALAVPAAAPALCLAAARPRLLEELASHPGTPEEVARDEDYWAAAQMAFTIDRSIINLNNGGVSPQPQIVQNAFKRAIDHANTVPPPIALWTEATRQREHVRARVARLCGVDAEEIAITRNSSESLQICQFGIDLARGDEVLTTTQDYPRMLTTFRQREAREGIKLVTFPIPVPCEEPAEIVRRFEAHITPRTRLILCSHIVNITGQILPVRDICRLARSRAIPVIVDGAHALAHFQFTIPDLECDYYAVSLHKWLFAPIGTGLLYVKRDRIPSLWPLMAADASLASDIRKFEEIGTHPAANFLAIAEAILFHEALGAARKEARLRYLRAYWTDRLKSIDGFSMLTPRAPALSCGIGVFRIEGMDHGALRTWLWDTHRILTVAVKHEEFEGMRVTPSVYTTLAELDRFAEVVTHAATKGMS